MKALPWLLWALFVGIAGPVYCQSIYVIKPKALASIESAATTTPLTIDVGDTPGFQRFRIALPDGGVSWSITITMPDGARIELNQANIVHFVAYDDVIAVPVSSPGTLYFAGTQSAPLLRHVSAVVRQPVADNSFPIGDFNLDAWTKWPDDYRKRLAPAMVSLWSSGKAGDRQCNATQIAPGVFATAHHCIRDVVDGACRMLASGVLKLFVEVDPLDAYGAPTLAALASAVIATPVYCGSSNADDSTPTSNDFAILATAEPVRNGVSLKPTDAVPVARSDLLLAAYLAVPASGRSGFDIKNYPPGLYLSRDSDCRVPPDPAANICPAGHIVHRCDSWPTMSGAALMTRTDARLVGVHYLGTNAQNCAVPWGAILDYMKNHAVSSQQKAVVQRFK